jgi:uncharacterized RDD family membrane protein YckC
MPIIQIGTAFNIDLEFEIAPFHKRLLAYIIDFLILLIYLFAMKSLLYKGLDMEISDNMGFDILVISVPMLFYSLITETTMNGQTIGKKLMSVRVISLDGGAPTFGQFLLRWITKVYEWPFLFGYVLLSVQALIVYIVFTGLLGIGVIIIITVTPKSQRLGDIAAGTVVVNTKSDLSISDTVFMNVSAENYSVVYPQVMRLTDSDINTIKNVLTQAKKRRNDEISVRVQNKIKEVLQIESNLSPTGFLEKLLEDYNYLATKE